MDVKSNQSEIFLMLHDVFGKHRTGVIPRFD